MLPFLGRVILGMIEALFTVAVLLGVGWRLWAIARGHLRTSAVREILFAVGVFAGFVIVVLGLHWWLADSPGRIPPAEWGAFLLTSVAIVTFSRDDPGDVLQVVKHLNHEGPRYDELLRFVLSQLQLRTSGRSITNELREQAIRELAGHHDPARVLQALGDADSPTARDLAQAIARSNRHGASEALVRFAANPALRLAAVKTVTSPALLAEAATKDGDPGVRKAALQNLNDASVLARVAQNDAQADLRQLAVKRLGEQQALAVRARTADDGQIRAAAVLAEVATKDGDPEVRKAALQGLSDASVLVRVAQSDAQAELRLLAVERLSEQQSLGVLARTADDGRVRAAAVRKLADRSSLGDIARRDAEPEVRLAAVERTTDEAVINDATSDSDARVRRAAVSSLRDPVRLAQVVRTDSEAAVRREAVSRLEDAALFAEIARSDPAPEVRKAAFEHPKARFEAAFLVSAVQSERDPAVREAIIGRLEDQVVLAGLATADADARVRRIAVGRVRDEDVLEQVVFGDPFADVRRAAIDRINDRARLQGLVDRLQDAELVSYIASTKHLVDPAKKRREAEREARLEKLRAVAGHQRCPRCAAGRAWFVGRAMAALGGGGGGTQPHDFAGGCERCQNYFCSSHADADRCPFCSSALYVPGAR